MEHCRLSSSIPIVVLVIFSVLDAQILNTTSDTDHGKKTFTTIEREQPSSTMASLMVASSPAPTLDRSCFTFAPVQDYNLTVTLRRNNGDYVYNRSENVTLTCVSKETENRSDTQPYVFIHSCRMCNGRWIPSEAGRGKVSMVLKGHEVFNASQNRGTVCEFSCWRYNSTCTHAWSQSDHVHFRPKRFECQRGHGVALRRRITFGDTPRPDGISCVSDNWTGLQCKWTLRRTTRTTRSRLEPESCTVTLYYRTKNDTSEGNITGPLTYDIELHDQVDDNTFLANFAVPSEHYGPFYRYSITFLVNTLFGDVTETCNVTADPKTAKFDPVQNLTVTPDDENSSVLHVSWDFPDAVQRPVEMYGLQCRLNLVPDETSAPWLAPVESIRDCRDRNRTATALHAHVTYKVQIDFRPKNGSYWSEKVTSWVTMPEDVPSRPPEVTTGGYVYTKPDRLSVYWKALAPELRNGKLTDYKVVVTGNSQRSQVNVSSGNSLSATMDQVNFTIASACVSARTSVGFSTESACIAVLSTPEPSVPSAPKEITVEYTSNNTYVVRWARWAAASSDIHVPDTLTVFWCWGSEDGTTSAVTCQNNMEWIHVHPNTTHHEVNADAMRTRASSDEKVTWRFGVASSVGNLSRGIVWSQCSFSDGRQVWSSVFDVKRTDDSTAIVTWRVNCDTFFTYARPQLYEFFVSRVTQLSEEPKCEEGNRTAVEWQKTSGQVIIPDLEPDVSYSVCMRTASVQGQSVDSDRKIILPVLKNEKQNGNNSFALFSAVGAAVIFTIFLVGVMIGLCCRKWKREASKFQPSIVDPAQFQTQPYSKQGLASLVIDSDPRHTKASWDTQEGEPVIAVTAADTAQDESAVVGKVTGLNVPAAIAVDMDIASAIASKSTNEVIELRTVTTTAKPSYVDCRQLAVTEGFQMVDVLLDNFHVVPTPDPDPRPELPEAEHADRQEASFHGMLPNGVKVEDGSETSSTLPYLDLPDQAREELEVTAESSKSTSTLSEMTEDRLSSQDQGVINQKTSDPTTPDHSQQEHGPTTPDHSQESAETTEHFSDVSSQDGNVSISTTSYTPRAISSNAFGAYVTTSQNPGLFGLPGEGTDTSKTDLKNSTFTSPKPQEQNHFLPSSLHTGYIKTVATSKVCAAEEDIH